MLGRFSNCKNGFHFLQLEQKTLRHPRFFKKKKKKPINNPGSAKFMQNILLEEEM